MYYSLLYTLFMCLWCLCPIVWAQHGSPPLDQNAVHSVPLDYQPIDAYPNHNSRAKRSSDPRPKRLPSGDGYHQTPDPMIVDFQTELYRQNKSTSVECHWAAVWKCGHRFIRAHKFLDLIGSRDSFDPKCALRSAFFVCLKTSKAKYCHKHTQQSHTKKFRKRLADTLWSTRACLVGNKNSVISY
ncbi:unnamed protein product [Oppiella nova]|uniref:Uncharacterized protein n=1 Tax=Oppiella nova TaxID=334625 RepID=A0A7R9MDK4_9ACAR|nr:unnamed protein product [Oppiella nova]CAG2175395.1 unnamed protein product [Oppiella nova]